MNNEARAIHVLVCMDGAVASALCRSLEQGAVIRTTRLTDTTPQPLAVGDPCVPDVIVVDVDERRPQATAAWRAVCDALPEVPVLLLSWYADGLARGALFRRRAAACLPKEFDLEPLQRAIVTCGLKAIAD